MLVRLWWKEWRSLVPIMATLVGAATALQWFLLSANGSEIRNGILVPIALSWGVLYALAAGSASFAGERENRTMGFLDAVPVGRGKLWLGKVTFAVGSSLLLGLILRWISSIGWSYASLPTPQMRAADPFFAVLIVEAAVWGLLWSSVCRTAIGASILAILSTGVMSSLSGWMQHLDQGVSFGGLDRSALTWRAGGMAVALLVSWLVLNREHWPRRQRRVVVREAVAPRPDLVAPTVSGWRIWPTPAYWSIVWQTVREGRGVWFQTLGLGFVAFLIGPNPATGIVVATLLALGLVIQGSSIFGIENSTGTRAFLDNQAVRPRTVWAAKFTPWLVGLGGIGLGIFALAWILASPSQAQPGPNPAIRSEIENWGPVWLGADLFAVAVLGGMIFARRVTAALISIMVGLALLTPQAALMTAQVIPGWGLALSPLLLLAASWFWAGDWLAGRGNRRWAKLAALVVIPHAALALTFIGVRAWGIADVGSQVGPANFANLPADDLGGKYREASAEIQMSQAVTDAEIRVAVNQAGTTNDVAKLRADYLAVNQPVLTRLHRLAAGPGVVAELDAPATSLVSPATTSIVSAREAAVRLLERDADALLDRGDLAAAWQDIETILRMSYQYAAGARSVAGYEAALKWSWSAIELAVTWSRHPKITVDLLRATRAKLREIPEPPTIVSVYQYEALRVERSLNQPGERWADRIDPRIGQAVNLAPGERIYDAWVLAGPWERERARRFLRRVEAVVLRNANRDHRVLPPDRKVEDLWPWLAVDGSLTSNAGRPLDPALHPDQTLVTALLGPFANGRNAYDTAVANRRLLDVYLALRTWQLTHDGRAPATLDELVPGELDHLPADPYATPGETFKYERTVDPWVGDEISFISSPSLPDAGHGTRAQNLGGPTGLGGPMGAQNPDGPIRVDPNRSRQRSAYRLWCRVIDQRVDPRGVGIAQATELGSTLPPDPPPTMK